MPSTVLSSVCIARIKMTDYLSSEEVKYLELSYIAFMRMQNGTATLKCLIVSYRIKHIPSYDQK